MATTPKRLKSGSWNTQVYLPNGKRKSITDPLKRVVEQKARDLEAAIRNGQSVHLRDRRVTVADWAAKWQEARNVDKATAKKDASQIKNHVLPRWGDWPLQAVSRSEVQVWVKDMTKAGHGANTVVGAYHRFAAMMADAVLEGLIGASPCREVDMPKVVRPAPRWLTRHEYELIQMALAVTPRAPVWQAYVGLACFSGLRPGELAGLDVEHVDFDRLLVRVEQVMTRHGLRAYPKSDTSVRTVPFPPEVGDLLWRVVGDTGGGAVFTTPRSDRVRDENFRDRVWGPAVAAAGIEPVRPYVMRHTMASWLVQAGVPPWEIAKMLGHSSTRLVDTYAHLAPDAHDRVRAAWGSPLAGSPVKHYSPS